MYIYCLFVCLFFNIRLHIIVEPIYPIDKLSVLQKVVTSHVSNFRHLLPFIFCMWYCVTSDKSEKTNGTNQPGRMLTLALALKLDPQKWLTATFL